MKESNVPKKVTYPPAHWMGLGIAMGIPIGIPIGLLAGFALKDVAMGIMIGPSFGIAIGTGIGWMLEQQHKEEMRHFTPEERSISKKLGLLGVCGLLVGILMVMWWILA
jgi:hypothetical protein